MSKYIYISVYFLQGLASSLNAMEDQPLFNLTEEDRNPLVRLNMGQTSSSSKSDKTPYKKGATSTSPKLPTQKITHTSKTVVNIKENISDEPKNERPLFTMREQE